MQGNYFIAVRRDSTDLKAWYLDTTSAATINTGWVAFGAVLAADAAGNYVVQSLPSASTSRTRFSGAMRLRCWSMNTP